MPSIRILLKALIVEPLTLLLSLLARFLPTWLAKALPSVTGLDLTHSHNYQPHPDAFVEGYYTRLTTASGDTVLLIFSSVRKAAKEHKPHLLHFSYIPQAISGSDNKALIFNIYPEKLLFFGRSPENNVELLLTAIDENDRTLGTYNVYLDGTSKYHLMLPVEDGLIEVEVQMKSRVVWGDSPNGSPEGPLAALIHLLPLHWFVWSVGSPAEINIQKKKSYGGEDSAQGIFYGKAKAHSEKNWGRSFPTGWIWIQSLVSGEKSSDDAGQDVVSAAILSQSTTPPYIALAGGSTLGLKAFLFGFSCPSLPNLHQSPINWTFRPAYTMQFPLLLSGAHISPFCKEEYNSAEGLYRLEVVDWSWKHGWRKVIIRGKGPAALKSSCDENTTTGSYIRLPCPVARGHDNFFAKETFEATVVIEGFAWRRKLGWGSGFSMNPLGKSKWEQVVYHTFEKAALEWGGDYWGTRSSMISDSSLIPQFLRNAGTRREKLN